MEVGQRVMKEELKSEFAFKMGLPFAHTSPDYKARNETRPRWFCFI